MREVIGDVWLEEREDGYLLGITKEFLEDSGDVTFVNFVKKPGEEFEKNETIISLETVKAAIEVKAPLPGRILEVNQALSEDPEPINEDPENTWLVKIEPKNR